MVQEKRKYKGGFTDAAKLGCLCQACLTVIEPNYNPWDWGSIYIYIYIHQTPIRYIHIRFSFRDVDSMVLLFLSTPPFYPDKVLWIFITPRPCDCNGARDQRELLRVLTRKLIFCLLARKGAQTPKNQDPLLLEEYPFRLILRSLLKLVNCDENTHSEKGQVRRRNSRIVGCGFFLINKKCM